MISWLIRWKGTWASERKGSRVLIIVKGVPQTHLPDKEGSTQSLEVVLGYHVLSS
jgi:hypothetical protein